MIDPSHWIFQGMKQDHRPTSYTTNSTHGQQHLPFIALNHAANVTDGLESTIWLHSSKIIVAAFHTPGLHGRNLQATRCVLGGKYRVKVVTLFLTHPFRKTPKVANGGRACDLVRLITYMMMVLNE